MEEEEEIARYEVTQELGPGEGPTVHQVANDRPLLQGLGGNPSRPKPVGLRPQAHHLGLERHQLAVDSGGPLRKKIPRGQGMAHAQAEQDDATEKKDESG